MSKHADIKKRALEALLGYRGALAKVEALEKEEATAHQELVGWRGRVQKSMCDATASIARSNLLGAGHEAISRLHNNRRAISKATRELNSAFMTLVAFDDALGYLPIPEATNSKVKARELQSQKVKLCER